MAKHILASCSAQKLWAATSGFGALATLVIAVTALPACSSVDDSPKEAVKLEGRYALESKSGAFAFRTLFFSKDGHYEATLATCADTCDEEGTFSYSGTEVVLRSESGEVTKLEITPTAEGRPATTLATERGVGIRSVAPPVAEATSEQIAMLDGCEERTNLSSSTLRTASSNPLLGSSSCLLSGLLTSFELHAPNGDVGTATFEGRLPPRLKAPVLVARSRTLRCNAPHSGNRVTLGSYRTAGACWSAAGRARECGFTNCTCD